MSFINLKRSLLLITDSAIKQLPCHLRRAYEQNRRICPTEIFAGFVLIYVNLLCLVLITFRAELYFTSPHMRGWSPRALPQQTSESPLLLKAKRHFWNLTKVYTDRKGSIKRSYAQFWVSVKQNDHKRQVAVTFPRQQSRVSHAPGESDAWWQHQNTKPSRWDHLCSKPLAAWCSPALHNTLAAHAFIQEAGHQVSICLVARKTMSNLGRTSSAPAATKGDATLSYSVFARKEPCCAPWVIFAFSHWQSDVRCMKSTGSRNKA